MAKERIVMIDDEEDYLLLCARRLRHHGYRVEIFTDAAKALKHIRTSKPDLIITDIKMPGLNGLEVCDCVRSLRQTNSTPIILMTGLKDKREYVESLNMESLFFMSKPFESDEFITTVKIALESSFQVDELTKYDT